MRLPVLLLSVAATATSLAAQPVSETITVQVIEIEATVIDRNGAPVDNLRREDFDVRVGGKAAEVTNFYRVDGGAVAGESRATTDAAAAPAAMPARLIIFIDDLHLAPGSKGRSLGALREYVETSMAPTTKPILIRWNGSMSNMNPAKSKAALLHEIDRIAREPVRSIHAASERMRVMRQADDVIDFPGPQADERAQAAMRVAVQYAEERRREADVTLDALKELVTLLAAYPGRKVVLYVSDGVPLRAGTETGDKTRR